jgi:diguanylate cyclase (GGDEF)-like protein
MRNAAHGASPRGAHAAKSAPYALAKHELEDGCAEIMIAAQAQRGLTAWFSAPVAVRVLSFPVVSAAAATTIVSLIQSPPPPVAFCMLAAAGLVNVELGRLVEGGPVTQQRSVKGLSAFSFASALLIGAGAAGLIGAVVYAAAWCRGMRVTLWKWLYSWAAVTLAAQVVALAVRADLAGGILGDGIPAHGSAASLALLLVLTFTFLGVATALLAAVITWNRDDDTFWLGQLRSPDFYFNEFAALTVGGVSALLVRIQPLLLILALPAYLWLQRGVLHGSLRDVARHDPKTGLLNFETWHALAAAQVVKAERRGVPVAALLLDLDHFKLVNDSFGHVTGDEVLVQVARCLGDVVREADLVCRFGGEEFSLLLVDADRERAVAVAERVRRSVQPLTIGRTGLQLTVSVGVGLPPSGRPTDLDALLEAADRALYAAKISGRDRVVA